MCEEPIVYFPFVDNAKTCGRCLLNVAVASFWWINLGMFPNFSDCHFNHPERERNPS